MSRRCSVTSFGPEGAQSIAATTKAVIVVAIRRRCGEERVTSQIVAVVSKSAATQLASASIAIGQPLPHVAAHVEDALRAPFATRKRSHGQRASGVAIRAVARERHVVAPVRI